MQQRPMVMTFTAFLWTWAVHEVSAVESYPTRELTSQTVRMSVYLPDAKRGYYRSTRFDWGGMIGQITVAGHTFCQPWRAPHDPLHTENAIGPAGEFGMHEPPGYRDAAPGGPFLKIGVGLLARDAEPYRFFAGYPVVDAGAWTVSDVPRGLEFRHELAGAGFAYTYRKNIVLAESEPSFTISYELVNRGTRPIVTDHYVHHFTAIDHQPIGPGYFLQVGNGPAAVIPGGLAWLRGRYEVAALVAPTQPIAGRLAGALPVAANRFVIGSNAASLVAVGDFATTAWEVYALPQALCVEPFMALAVDPGQQLRWSTTYRVEVGR